jgi:glycosyltransferase involved in cell wall biosynthesis
MVIDCPSQNPLPLHLDQFPGNGVIVIKGWPTAQDFRPFLDGLDVVYTAECDYTRDGTLYSLAHQMGVKTVLHLNWEFFEHARNPNLPRPSLFAAPSMWHWDEIPEPKTFLPVPIELNRFPARPTPSTAIRFMHIIGRPAVHDRNGTRDLLAALQYVQSEIVMTIKCQDPQYVPRLLPAFRIPGNISLIVDGGDIPNYWDNYRDADVLVLPRRFGGLSLPVNEALGAGMPVVMPAISPNEWLPAEWLVPAEHAGSFQAKTKVDLYSVDARALAAQIDRFATDRDFYAESVTTVGSLGKEMSWDNQKSSYDRLFADLVAA